MFGAVHESGYGPKRTSQCAQPMSAFEGKADIAQTSENVRLTLSGPRRGVYLLHTRHRAATSSPPIGTCAKVGRTQAQRSSHAEVLHCDF
jgi:hypothetical protein